LFRVKKRGPASPTSPRTFAERRPCPTLLVDTLCLKRHAVARLAWTLCWKSKDAALLAQTLCWKSKDVALLARALGAKSAARSLHPGEPSSWRLCGLAAEHTRRFKVSCVFLA
jgi:hypothetical protein